MNRVLIAILILPSAVSAAEPPPGVVVDHSPVSSKQYVGSPGLCVLPSGEYLASHDFFGPGSTKDTTVVFASADRGKHWSNRSTIRGQWWSSLFVHAGAVYLMGTSKEYGFAVIRRSTDGGKTWSEPKDGATGLLLGDAKYHCAPVPVVVHGGRVWRAMEEYTGPKWGAFKAFVMSAPADADLLAAKNWTSTNRLAGDPAWLGGTFGGWLEGNVVVTPEGQLVNLLRVQQPKFVEHAARTTVSPDGKTLSFDPSSGFPVLPGGAKKFTIRFDPVTKRYWTLANDVPREHRSSDRTPDKTRNTLSLWSSADLNQWAEHRRVASHPDAKTHGFQYVDWQFDGNDLIALVRTAWDDPDGTPAHNAHDANYLTFLRVERFRETGR